MSEEEGFDSIASDVPTVCLQAVELGKNIIAIIEGTQAGFDEQSKMLKKMGLKLFKKNAGMPIEEWLQYAKDLVPVLENMAKSIEKGDEEEVNQAMAPILEAKLKLIDLKENYIKTANMAKKFLKGEDLDDALDGLNLSERRISLLIEAIEFLEKK